MAASWRAWCCAAGTSGPRRCVQYTCRNTCRIRQAMGPTTTRRPGMPVTDRVCSQLYEQTLPVYFPAADVAAGAVVD